MLSSAEILQQLLEQNQMGVKQFADKINYPASKLHDIKRGKTQRFSGELIERIIATFPDIDRFWLLTGEDIAVIQKSYKSQAGLDKSRHTQVKNVATAPREQNLSSQETCSSQATNHAINNKRTSLPLIPIEAVAGHNGIDEQGVRLEDCPSYQVPEFISAKAEYMIRVSGSSMYPKYSNGDILACRKVEEITFFQWGKVYVIDSNQGAMIKRLFEIPDAPDMVLCKSDNDNYPPFKLPKSEIRSLSIVIGVIRLE